MVLPLDVQLQAAGLPDPVCEFSFAPGRGYRSDLAWPELGILVEVEGGVWTQGRHTRGKGYQEDCRKYNLACEMGYRLFRFTTDMVASGEALAVLERVLRGGRG